MKKNRLALIALALVVLMLVGAGAGVGAKPTTIAVVDVFKVFKDAQIVMQLVAARTTKAQELQETFAKLKQEINSDKDDLEMFVEKSGQAYKEKKQKFDFKLIHYEATKKFHQQQLLYLESESLERVYRQLLKSVDRVATANGIDLVLFKAQEFQFNAGKPRENLALIANRRVLWVKKDLDISDQVIQDMDNQLAK